jgi:hypothetical protein
VDDSPNFQEFWADGPTLRVSKGLSEPVQFSNMNRLLIRRTQTAVFLGYSSRGLALRAAERSRLWFHWLDVIFPPRITEEVGDALEWMDRIAADPNCKNPVRKIRIKRVTTVFWVIVNSIRYFMSGIMGRKAE